MKNIKSVIASVILTLLFAIAACMIIACEPGSPVETGETTTKAADTKAIPSEPPVIKATAGMTVSGNELTVDGVNHDYYTVDGMIKVTEGADRAVFRDEACTDPVGSRTVSLTEGENVYWIKLTLGDQSTLYKLTVIFTGTEVTTVPVTEPPVETTSPEDTSSSGGEFVPPPEVTFAVTDRGAGDIVDYPG